MEALASEFVTDVFAWRCDSCRMMRLMVGPHPWQQVPAPQARPTSETDCAPSRTARRTVLSETPLQWHTSIVSVLASIESLRVDTVKMKINVIFTIGQNLSIPENFPKYRYKSAICGPW